MLMGQAPGFKSRSKILAEKIGQMTQAERASVDTDTSKITTDNLGSLLSGGGSVPTPNTPTAWADMVYRYQRAALATRRWGAGICSRMGPPRSPG